MHRDEFNQKVAKIVAELSAATQETASKLNALYDEIFPTTVEPPPVEPPLLIPPKIILITVSNITNQTATVAWTMDTHMTGQVEYGETTNYGQKTVKEESFKFASHKQVLTGLKPNTNYNFRVICETEGGLQVISPNETFKTMADTVVPTPTPVTPTPVPPPTPPPSKTRFNLKEKLPIRISFMNPGGSSVADRIATMSRYKELGYNTAFTHGRVKASSSQASIDAEKRVVAEMDRLGLKRAFEVAPKLFGRWGRPEMSEGFAVKNVPMVVKGGILVPDAPYQPVVPPFSNWRAGSGVVVNGPASVTCVTAGNQLRTTIPIKPGLYVASFDVDFVSTEPDFIGQFVWLVNDQGNLYREEIIRRSGHYEAFVHLNENTTKLGLWFRSRDGVGKVTFNNFTLRNVSHELTNMYDGGISITEAGAPLPLSAFTITAPNVGSYGARAADRTKGTISTSLKDGTKVKVTYNSWAAHRVSNENQNVNDMRWTDKVALDALEADWIAPWKKVFGELVDAVLIHTDEIRGGINRDTRSLAQGMTNAEALVFGTNEIAKRIWKHFPNALILIYDDMFDLNRNGWDGYQVRYGGSPGTTEGAFEKLLPNIHMIVWTYTRTTNDTLVNAAWPFEKSGVRGGIGPGQTVGSVDAFIKVQGANIKAGKFICAALHDYNGTYAAILNAKKLFDFAES